MVIESAGGWSFNGITLWESNTNIGLQVQSDSTNETLSTMCTDRSKQLSLTSRSAWEKPDVQHVNALIPIRESSAAPREVSKQHLTGIRCTPMLLLGCLGLGKIMISISDQILLIYASMKACGKIWKAFVHRSWWKTIWKDAMPNKTKITPPNTQNTQLNQLHTSTCRTAFDKVDWATCSAKKIHTAIDKKSR